MDGFPGVRGHGKFFISRRNVEKGNMTSADFVEVLPDEDVVRYYGENKPSVDSPVQVRIFNAFPDVNYILHGHVYIKGAPLTSEAFPCGAVDEFKDVSRLMGECPFSRRAINLLGHGFLVMGRTVADLRNLEFEARPFPEIHGGVHA